MTFDFDHTPDDDCFVDMSMPTTERTISGTFDTFDNELLRGVMSGAPADRALEIMPKGARWPWYPLFHGRAVVTSASEGDTVEGSYGFTYRWTDGPHVSRVGVRRSWQAFLSWARS